MTRTPVIFTTLGDAGGIGPELVARSLAVDGLTAGVQRLIVGPKSLLEQGCQCAAIDVALPTYDDPAEAIRAGEPVAMVDFAPDGFTLVDYGQSSRIAGELDLAIARLAADLHVEGLIDGLTFAPVNKLSLKMGGSDFEGYKAYIADYLGCLGTSDEINTIGDLWTTRVTSHVALADVPSLVTRENVLKTIRYFDSELRTFGYDPPRIAVSGLNPHNGDGGIFGREEIDHIAPAVEEAKAMGINVSGPYPADTIFLTARDEAIPAVLSMYHDQCQIATKLLGFDEGVTYFGGLPLPLTTPAHGTAYDIAGLGKASPTPFNNALKTLCRALHNRKARNDG